MTLRTSLIQHLNGGMAFIPIHQLVEKIPYDQLTIRPDGLPYSLWEQMWHMMMAQKDIIEFSLDSDYREPKWPDDYWPKEKPTKESWQQTINEFMNDREKLIKAVEDEPTDLQAPLENDASKTLLREVLLVIEHNAYHTGQILVIMRQLGLHG